MQLDYYLDLCFFSGLSRQRGSFRMFSFSIYNSDLNPDHLKKCTLVSLKALY